MEISDRIAATVAASADACAALDASEAARKSYLATKEELLTHVGILIERDYPILTCTVKDKTSIEVDTNHRPDYDDEHGWTRCTIGLSITPRYGVRFDLASLTDANGEHFGASIITGDIDKLLRAMATYAPLIMNGDA
jgi:hypothetical protein